MAASQLDLQWFAPEDEGRTEEASEYKLRKAREEGRVAKSQELNGTIVYLFCTVLLVFLGPWIEEHLVEMMYFFFNHVTTSNITDGAFAYVFARCFLFCVIPFCLVGIFAGVTINLIQNRGFIFTTKTITPKFSKIIPKFGEYFKRTLFSGQGLFNIAKSILKVAIIGIIAFFMIRSNLPTVLELLHVGGPQLALKRISGMVARLMLVSAVVLLVFAILDYIVQRRVFKREMKMTKQEVKQEYKEMEGDPEVKGHLESAQKQLLSQNMPKAVKESDVVITNPTHYAVALRWRQELASAPEVSAKGTDLTAQNMKRIAYENDVPVVENKPLARSLYTNVEIGDIIPNDYLQIVATVYAQVGYMNKNKDASGRG